MKEKIKNVRLNCLSDLATRQFIKNFSLFMTMLSYSLKCKKKIQKVKIQNL